MMFAIVRLLQRGEANLCLSLALSQSRFSTFSRPGNLASVRGLLQTNDTPKSHHDELVFSTCTSLMKLLIDCSIPIVAQVNGIAAAAGCKLVAMCNIVVTSNNATFSTPGVNLNYNNIKLSFAAKEGESVMVNNLQFQDTQEGLKSFAKKRKPKFQDQ